MRELNWHTRRRRSPASRFAPSRLALAVSSFAAGFLVRPILGLGLEPLAAQLFADPAIVEITALRRAFGRLVPLWKPVAERIAEPRRLRLQRAEVELLPYRLGAFHVFLFRQGQRWHVAFHGGVHQQGRILLLIVLAFGPVTLTAMRDNLHVLDRVH